MDFGGLLFVGLMAGLLVFLIVTVVGSLRQEARTRELKHIERMKALEMGVPLPGDRLLKPLRDLQKSRDGSSRARAAERQAMLSHRCLTGSLVLPAVAVVASLILEIRGPEAIALWAAVATVASTGLICGTILALVPTRVGRSEPSDLAEKPRFDPDFEGPEESHLMARGGCC